MAVFTKWPILAKLNHRPNFFIRYIERRHRKVQHTTRWTKLNREKVLQFDPNVENRRPQNCRFARAASADPKHRRPSFITLNWGEDSHLSQELKDFVLLQRIRSQWSNRNRQFWKIISRKQWWWSRERERRETQKRNVTPLRTREVNKIKTWALFYGNDWPLNNMWCVDEYSNSSATCRKMCLKTAHFDKIKIFAKIVCIVFWQAFFSKLFSQLSFASPKFVRLQGCRF